MENSPFTSSQNKTEQTQEKVSKANLLSSLTAMQEPYGELVEISTKVNRLFEFSIEDITNRIQKMTDNLESLSEDADEKTLSSLNAEISELENSLRARISTAKIKLNSSKI